MAAEDVRELRAIAKAAANVERRHRRTEEETNKRRRLLVCLVYLLCGSTDWAMMAARALGVPTRLEALPHQEALPRLNALPFQDAAALLVRAQALLHVWPPPASVQVAGRLVAELRILGVFADASARGVALTSKQLIALLRQAWPPLTCGAKARKFLLRLRHLPRARESFAHDFRLRWDVRWRRLSTPHFVTR